MNLCEALESGKRYNRALHLSIWPDEVYVYAVSSKDSEGDTFKLSVWPDKVCDEREEHLSFSFNEMELTSDQWHLSDKAPYYGPAGMLTLERAREMAAQAWCTPENEQKVMDCDLCEAFAQVMMKIGNGTIAFIEQKEEVTSGEEQSSVSE